MNAEEAVNQLNSLKSVDAIVALFEKEGIKGVRYSAYECPVTNYMFKMTGIEDKTAIVTGRNSTVVWKGMSSQTLYLSDPVTAFTLEFDGGRYPSLVEDVEDVEDVVDVEKCLKTQWESKLSVRNVRAH